MNEDVKQSAWFPAVDNLISGVCMVERESQTGDKDSVICVTIPQKITEPNIIGWNGLF